MTQQVWEVRSLFEQKKIKPTLLLELYKGYNPVPHLENLLQKVSFFFPI